MYLGWLCTVLCAVWSMEPCIYGMFIIKYTTSRKTDLQCSLVGMYLFFVNLYNWPGYLALHPQLLSGLECLKAWLFFF